MNSHCFAFRVGLLRVVSLAAIMVLLDSGPALAQFVPVKMYVNAAATGSNPDGSSWAKAWHTLDDGIANQLPGGALWVAVGNYIPTNLTTGFYITKPLQLYGGFVGTETSIAQRLPTNFGNTVLDGNNYTALHVVTISHRETDFNVFDGFKIWKGYCISPPNTGNGAGILADCVNLSLANLTVTDNHAISGGGLYIKGGCPYITDPPEEIIGPPRVLRIKNSHFINNVADQQPGGGIYGEDIYGEIVNVDFRENHSPVEGGGVFLWKMGTANRVDFIDCAFYANFVSTNQFVGAGGGLRLSESSPPTNPPDGGNAQVINCTFDLNTCNQGGDGQAVGISTHSLCPIYNSILYWNWTTPPGRFNPLFGTFTPVADSDIELWQGGGSNVIDVDPKWVDEVLGDLRLSTNNSDCVDAADWDKRGHDDLDVNGNGNVTELLPLDVSLTARTFNNGMGVAHGGHGTRNYLDMGAYERGKELIANGDFSAGTTGWTVVQDFWVGTSPPPPEYHSSPVYAAGGVNASGTQINNAVGELWQPFTIPAGTTTLRASFYYYITTTEPTPGGHDFLNATIQNSAGQNLATVALLSDGNFSGGYQLLQVDIGTLLPQYAGQTLRIHFLATSNGSNTSKFRIDDVSIMSW